MSKQLKKLSYEPETITINVVGAITTDSGTLTISQIKVLLENTKNTITYQTSVNYSEVLHLAQADYENATAPKATYTADYYDSSTNVYYKHIITVSYNTLFNSATWAFVSAPMVSGSSSDLQEKLVSGSNIKTINNNSLLGSGNLDIIPTIVASASQVVSQEPLRLQLMDAQYNVFVNNKQVFLDLSALGLKNMLFYFDGGGETTIYFTCLSYITETQISIYSIQIDTSTKVATAVSDDCGRVAWLAKSVEVLTTAPISDNTSGLKFAVLSSEPATKYDGYLYLITGSN